MKICKLVIDHLEGQETNLSNQMRIKVMRQLIAYSYRSKGLRVAINVSTKMTKVKLSYITIEQFTVIEMK